MKRFDKFQKRGSVPSKDTSLNEQKPIRHNSYNPRAGNSEVRILPGPLKFF